MSDQDDEQMELAVRGFRNAVLSFCRRCTKQSSNVPLPPKIQDLVDHVGHVLRQLTRKRKSLQHGLSYLQTNLWPKEILGRFRNTYKGGGADTVRVKLLQHFLEQCLRLHDGLLLLVSGECRHAGDIRTAKRQATKLRSRLSSQTHRPDGYTKMYNAPGGYSGYGWDEFHDAEVGIRTRLLQALQSFASSRGIKQKTKEKIWDYLMSHGGEALEARLDHHESEMNLLEQRFTTLRDQVVRDLKSTIAKNAAAMGRNANTKSVAVSFVLHDKMEKLRYDNIVLERQGDAFQVNDPQGALPNGYTVHDWSRVMKLPQPASQKSVESSRPRQDSTNRASSAGASSKSMATKRPASGAGQKRRLVILEDSSDEEDAPNVKNPSKPCGKQDQSQNKVKSNGASANSPLTPLAKSSGSGLNVKVAKLEKPQTPGEGTSLSLAKIKVQMGADVQALEAAREEVEKEEAVASKAAKTDEVEAMATTIEEGEANIRRQRLILKRVLRRKENIDVKEIWDARELLREQLMAVGNQILWVEQPMDDNSTTTQERKARLLVAYKYFEEAKTLVDEQDTFRRSLRAQGKYSTTEACFYSRNLLLLLGYAHTNMGITNIELATEMKRKTQCRTAKETKRYLRDAVKELGTAKEFAQSLRSRASTDTKNWGSNIVETAVDSIRADKLESLVMRWLGTALWHQGKRKESRQQFEAGAALFSVAGRKFHDMAASEKAIHNVLCQLGSECFYACIALADLVSEDIEKLPPTAKEEGDQLLSYVKGALIIAGDVVESIEKFFRSNPSEELTFDEFLQQHEVMGKEDIQLYSRDTENWWERRRTNTNLQKANDSLAKERRPFPLPRSEVEPLGLEKMPARRFTIDEGSSRRQKRKRRGANPMYHQNSGNLLSAVPQLDDEQDPNSVGDQCQPKKYRPWGDELLPQTIDKATGRSIPKLEYPCTAPPMPPEIRAFLEAA